MGSDGKDELSEDVYASKVAEVVKNIAIPQITHAYVSGVSEHGNKLTVTTKWKQRNYQLAKTNTFSVVYHYNKHTRNIERISPPLETNSILLERISPSLQQTAVIKKHTNDTSSKDEYVLEFWSNILNKRTKTVNLSSLDKHGQVHSAGMFGQLSWSCDESKLIYVAEKKADKTCGYFDKAKEGQIPGNKYVYKENWGEQLTEVSETVLCVYYIHEDSIEVVKGVPENVSPLRPVFGPGDTIIFPALQTLPFRLGSIGGVNRQCGIYMVGFSDTNNLAVELTKSFHLTANYNPQLNKAKTKMVFNRYKLSGAGDPHRMSSSLMVYNLKEEVATLLCCELIRGEENIALYTDDDVAYNIWLTDDVHIAVPTSYDGRQYISIIDSESGVLKSMTTCTSTLGLYDNIVLCSYQKLTSESFNLMMVDADNPEQVIVAKEEEKTHAEFENGDIVDEYGIRSFYLMPKADSMSDRGFPLLVTPHGGPHSVYTDNYNESAQLFCKLGYAVLLVNYRGSSGYPDSSLRSLPGNIGTQDVSDVQDIVNQFINLKSSCIDTENVFCLGISHGGFLCAHLISQFPHFYRAACLCNPVIEISSMSIASDTPDWTYVESGLDYTQDVIPTSGSVSSMLGKSPIIHVANVRAPVLLCIGGKDVRVPPSQGMHYFRVLKANNKVVKMLYYPSDGHPLSNVETSADSMINICKWFFLHGTHSR